MSTGDPPTSNDGFNQATPCPVAHNGCRCECHTTPGIIHFKACCFPAETEPAFPTGEITPGNPHPRWPRGNRFRFRKEWLQVSSMPSDPMQVRFGSAYPTRWVSRDILQVAEDTTGELVWHDVPVDHTPMPVEVRSPTALDGWDSALDAFDQASFDIAVLDRLKALRAPIPDATMVDVNAVANPLQATQTTWADINADLERKSKEDEI